MLRSSQVFATSLVAVVCSAFVSVSAQSTVYWDINGSAPGAGNQGGFTDGVWGIDPFWSPDPNGEASTGAWVPGDNAVFSAGNDAVDHFIDVDGTQTANSLTVEDGVVFIASGTVDRGTGNVVVENGATLRINSTLRLNNGGRIILRDGTLWQSNPGLAGSFVGGTTVIEIDGTGTIDRTAIMDDGSPSAEPLGRQINIFTTSGNGTIAGTGGTPENGGAGTLIKTGPSEFRYQGTGLPLTSYAKLVVNEGLFRLGFNAGVQDARGFGANPLVETPDAVTLDGGAIGTAFSLAGGTMHPNRGVTIGPNGGTFNVSGGALGIPGPLTAASGTTLTVVGTSTVQLSNANNVNTFNGNVVIDGGRLQLAESLSTPNFSGADGDVNILTGNQFTVGSSGNDNTYSGDVLGGGVATSRGQFVKVGSGTQTLSGTAGVSTADMFVEEGTLRFTDAILADTANVSLSTGGLLNLDFTGTNAIASLLIDDVGQALGTWGATGSGADNETALITGSGLLQVTVFDPGGLIGDYNDDGFVNLADYTVWRDNLGGDGSVLMNRDSANVGVVGAGDYASWKANFGMSGAAGALQTASVPEPATALLAVLSLAGIVAIGRKQGR